MRFFALALLFVFSTPAYPAASQPAEKFGWAQVFSPDRLAKILAQYAVQAARGYVDLTYQDLTIDIIGSEIDIAGLELLPLPEWDSNGDCLIRLDRVSVQGAPLSDIENTRSQIAIFGLTAPLVCLPPEARVLLVAAGLDQIEIARLDVTLDYNLPSGAAQARISGRVPNFAVLEIFADLDYLSLFVRDGPENSYPVIYLKDAFARIENLGGWEALMPVLPPALTDSATASDALEAILVGSLERNLGSVLPLPEDQARFVRSATSAWVAFLEAPRALEVRLAGDDDEAVFVDVASYDDTPGRMFQDLRPVASAGGEASAALLPQELLAAAANRDATLSADARLLVAQALLSGEGAPRNTALGLRMLEELAAQGLANAEFELARALAASDADLAYRWALSAAAKNVTGARLLLDQLERNMAWQDIQRAQPALDPKMILPADIAADPSVQRALAQAALRGDGTPRSYARAMFWALIGKASGDAESALIMSDIEHRVGKDGAAGLQAFLGPIETAAFTAWIAREQQ